MRRMLPLILLAFTGCAGMSTTGVRAAAVHEARVTRVPPIAGPTEAARLPLAGAMLARINQDRRAVGLPGLHTVEPLARVALDHSLDMATHDYVSHFTLGGVSPATRIEAVGIHFYMAGENLGMDAGYGDARMLRRIDLAMLNSPEHRANILRRAFNHVGIGIAVVGNRLFITEDFTN